MHDPRVILISGASRGIGKALALGAGAEGLAVIVNYRRNEEAAQTVVDSIVDRGGRAVAVQADVSIAEEVQGLVDSAVAQFGRIDCVVNNAGVARIATLDILDEALFAETLRLNLVSAFLVSQAAVPHMKAEGGRLVFLSSGAAKTGGRVSAAYAASKAGIEGLMHYYATYLRPHRITANAIAPTLIETDMVGEMNLPPPEELPLGRLGQPQELWPALRMILDTEYLTGQTLHVDAGRYMT